jgi:hypothetical protein
MAQIGVWNICYRPVLSVTNIASVECKFEVMSVLLSVASICTAEDFAHEGVPKLCT